MANYMIYLTETYTSPLDMEQVNPQKIFATFDHD